MSATLSTVAKRRTTIPQANVRRNNGPVRHSSPAIRGKSSKSAISKDSLARRRNQSHASPGTMVVNAQNLVNSESEWGEVVRDRYKETELVDDDSDGPPVDNGEEDDYSNDE